MDTYREHPSDFDLPSAAEAPPQNDVAAAIGTDERRMHVRAYNYWVALLGGRDFPSIEDLEPADVEDFAANSVLLDFTCGRDDPAIPYVGAAIHEECGLGDNVRTIADVPSRSLLSRLTDHYMQIIANRAPVGFEAEYDNPRGESICYRGILMPFSSDGDTIDFIYGVINWKQAASAPVQATVVQPAPAANPVDDETVADWPTFVPAETETQETEQDEAALELTDLADASNLPAPAWMETDQTGEFARPVPPAPDAAAEPSPEDLAADPAPHVPAAPHFSWEDGPLGDEDAAELPAVEIAPDAGLADRLWAARETAESVKAGEGRTRTALYRALSLAYDFAAAAQDNPNEYAELLEDSGVKAQARAPMTPIVKLVFGVDYDKARLTEFAAALAFAQRQQISSGGFQAFIEGQAGGLKALVAAERQARRPEGKADGKADQARAKLRSAPAISLADVAVADEFAVVVTRRGADGRHELVAVVEDEALVERAIRHVA